MMKSKETLERLRGVCFEEHHPEPQSDAGVPVLKSNPMLFGKKELQGLKDFEQGEFQGIRDLEAERRRIEAAVRHALHEVV